jgi:hypothetical protein
LEVAAQPKADPKKIGIALGIMAILENMYKNSSIILIFTPLEQLWHVLQP